MAKVVSRDERRGGVVLATIADQLYDVLCERIVTGQYAPGQRLDMQAIAEEHGVSKTPVRDALAELENDRLIETRPRSGTFVARLRLRDIHEVCQLRKAIEWLATGMATENMPGTVLKGLREEALRAQEAARKGDFEPFFHSDTRLHSEIVQATGNTRLIQVRSSVQPFVKWLQVMGATGAHRIDGSTARHLEIIDAMLDRDAERASSAAAVHLDEVEKWTAEDMAELGIQ